MENQEMVLKIKCIDYSSVLAILVKNTNKRVLYITSETFVNEFIEITRKKEDKNDFDNIDFFKKKYRDIDVLLVDDIQFLAKKTESQKEFFHTFNNLYGDEKQIIISGF